jgi:hypothetical protein
MRVMSIPNLPLKRLSIAVWTLLIAYLFVLAIDSIVAKPGVDSSIYIYVGKGILEGEIPYLDRWDNKGPLLYALNALAHLIDPTWGLWLVQAFFLLGTAICAFLAIRKPFGTLPASFALALFLVFYSKFAPPGNFTEQFGILFQFATLYLFFRSQEQADSPANNPRFALLHLSIGVLGAAAFLLRPNLVALWIVIGLYWLFLRGVSLRRLAWAVVGGGSVLIAVAAYFTAIGALGALWEAVFLYNFAHSDAGLGDRIDVLRDLGSRTNPIQLFVIAGWCIGVYSVTRMRPQGNGLIGLLTVGVILLPLEIFSLTLSGYSGSGFLHYYLLALPVSTLLGAYLVYYIANGGLADTRLVNAVLLLGVLALTFSFSQFGDYYEKYFRVGVFTEDRTTLVGKRIRELTRPGDYILVWGYDPRIYLHSGRNASTRFIHQNLLVKPSPINEIVRNEFYAEQRDAMPALIVDIRHPRFPPLASADRANWRPVHRYVHDPSIHQPFYNFVEDNYVLIEIYENYLLYMPRSEEAIDRPDELGELIIRSVYDVYLNDRILTYIRDECTQADAGKRFILQVTPRDRSAIGGNESANLDFSFNPDADWQPGDSCEFSRELPDYPIVSIRTGQYNAARTRHDWLEEYQVPPAE